MRALSTSPHYVNIGSLECLFPEVVSEVRDETIQTAKRDYVKQNMKVRPPLRPSPNIRGSVIQAEETFRSASSD